MFPLSIALALFLALPEPMGSPSTPANADMRPLDEEVRTLFHEVFRRHRAPLRRCELEQDWVGTFAQTEPVIERHLGRRVDTSTHREPNGVLLRQMIEVPAGALCTDEEAMATATRPNEVIQGIWTSGPAMGRPILQRLAFAFPVFSADRRRAVVPFIESSYSWSARTGGNSGGEPEWQPRLFIGYADLYERQRDRWTFLRRQEVVHMTYVPDERRR